MTAKNQGILGACVDHLFDGLARPFAQSPRVSTGVGGLGMSVRVVRKHLACDELFNGVQASTACGVVAVKQRLDAKGGINQFIPAHDLLPEIVDKRCRGEVFIGLVGGHR